MLRAGVVLGALAAAVAGAGPARPPRCPARGPALPNDRKILEPVGRLTGNLSPKSVVASGTGLYFAQNMMYRHTISVFDETKTLIKTIPDSVDLKAYGYDVAGDSYRGAPVEARVHLRRLVRLRVQLPHVRRGATTPRPAATPAARTRARAASCTG